MAIGNVIQNAMDKLFMDNLTKVNQDNAKQNADILKISKRELELREFMVDNENAYYMQSLDKLDDIAHEYKLARTANGKQGTAVAEVIESEMSKLSSDDAETNSAISALLNSETSTALVAVENDKAQTTALTVISDSTKKIAKVLDQNRKDAIADKTAGLVKPKDVSKGSVKSSTTKTKTGFNMKMFMGGLGKILKALFNPVAFITAFIMKILPWVLIFGAFFIGIWKKLDKRIKAKLKVIGAAILAIIAIWKGWMGYIMKGVFLIGKAIWAIINNETVRRAAHWVKLQAQAAWSWATKKMMAAKEAASTAAEHSLKMAATTKKMTLDTVEHSTGMLAWAKRMMQDLIIYIKELAKTAYEYILAGLKAIVYYAKIAFQIALSVSAYLLVALAVVAIVLIFAGLLILIFKAISWIVKEVIGVVKDIFKAIVDLFGPMVKELINIILTIAMGIAMIVFWPYIIIGLLGKMIFKVLSSVLEGITKALTAVIEGTIGALIKGIEPVFETVGEILHAVFSVVKVLIPVAKFLGKVIGLIVDVIGAIFEVILVPIKAIFNALKEVILALKPVFEGIWSLLKPIVMVIGAVFQAVGGILSAIGEVITDVLSPLLEVFMPLVQVIKTVLKWITLPLKIIMKIFGGIMKVFGKIFELFGQVIEAVFMPIAAVIDFVVGLISAVVKVIGGVLAVLMAPFKWLFSLFGGGDDEEEKKEDNKEVSGPDSDLYYIMENEKISVIEDGFNSVIEKLNNLKVTGGGLNTDQMTELLGAVNGVDENMSNLNNTTSIFLKGIMKATRLVAKGILIIAGLMTVLVMTIFSPLMLLFGGLGAGIGLLGGLFSDGFGNDMSSFFADEDEDSEDNAWKKFMESVQKNVQNIRDAIVGEESGSFVTNLFATNKSEAKNSTSYATLAPSDSVVQKEMVQPDVNVSMAGNNSDYSNSMSELISLLRKIEQNTGKSPKSIMGV